jgi:hypothetical protein
MLCLLKSRLPINERVVLMKKRYHLSMLSIFPLTLLFDEVYIPALKTIEMFLLSGAVHFVLFVPVNLMGVYLFYKPIDRIFRQEKITAAARVRVRRLTWYSTWWIFFTGVIYFTGMMIAILQTLKPASVCVLTSTTFSNAHIR